MARYKYQGTWTDGNGRRIDSATVSAYLAGGTTAASVYIASTGGGAVNSVTTDTSGLYEFWVDDTDYTQDQLFKITMSKASFQSTSIDDIEIFKSNRLVLKGSENYYIDGRTDPRTITLGAVRQEHTAGTAGTRAYHVDVRSGGYDDTNAFVVRLDPEGGSDSIKIKAMNVHFDITGATNAHLHGMEVAKTGVIGSGILMQAMDVREGVDVIHHHSGAAGAVDTAFKYDDSGASYTDVTTEFGSTGSDVSLFDEDSDYIYLGHTATFGSIEVILATGASKSIKPIFEYSQGASAWNTVSVSDDTNGFREDGNILFEAPGDWATDTVNAVGSKYWIRIQRNNSNVPVVPIEDTIKVTSATEYEWNADGDLTINSITSASTATFNGTFAGTAFQDDDTFASASATKVASSESIKAYIDNSGIAQVVHTADGAVATGTTTMPADDTIPQNTEGDQYLSLAITPTNSTNKLLIEVQMILANDTGADTLAALFQDIIVDALSASIQVGNAGNDMRILNIKHEMTAGTTSETIFKARGGCSAAGTTTFNGVLGVRKFGGVMNSYIRITEYKP